MPAASPTICPRCWCNLVPEQPMADGPFRYDSVDGLSYNGVKVRLSRQERELVGSLLHAKGRLLSPDAIVTRLDSETENPPRLVSVLLAGIRRKLRQLGAPNPIKTHPEYGAGWRWLSTAPTPAA